MLKYPIVQPTSFNKYMLKEPLVYKNIQLVPEGYITNGANVPKAFYWFVPPFKPKYLPAVIVHDYYCDKEEYKKADDLFEEILLDIEDSFTTRMMIKAVRLYHRVKYGVK